MAQLDVVVNVVTKGSEKLGGVGKSLGGLGKVAILGAAGVASAVGIAGAAFAGMAADAEKGQAKLKNTFKTMGADAFTTVDALNEQAGALAKVTQFDDDAITEAQATMLTFGNVTGEVFDRSIVAAADMAAFFETDVAGASLALGKAINDPVKGLAKLSKQGVTFTEDQEAMVRSMVEAGDTAGAQAIILGELERQVGGTATAMADTAGGQMAQAMEDLGEAGESIGTLLLPVLATVAQGLAKLAEFVVAAMPTIQAAIAPVISFITGLFSGLGAPGGPVSGLTALFQKIVDFWVANGPVIMSLVGQVVGAIGNVIASLWPIIERVANILFPLLATAASVLFGALDLAFKGIGGAFEVLGPIFKTTSDIILGIVEGVVGAFKAVYNAFAGFWNSIDISVPSIDIPFVGTVGGFSFGLPDIPMMAKGGIVTRPTLALIGESGPEAVIPLRGSETASTVNNFEFHIQSPIPDDKGIVSLVNRSQRLQAMLP